MRLLEQCMRTTVTTRNTTPARYDVPALAIIEPMKHQRLAERLLQSAVVTRNNRVLVCCKEHCFR